MRECVAIISESELFYLLHGFFVSDVKLLDILNSNKTTQQEKIRPWSSLPTFTKDRRNNVPRFWYQ